MTEDEYLEQQREAEQYYHEQEQRDLWYEWLSAFEFLQRTLEKMRADVVAVQCGAVEMFETFLQKQWEQAPKRLLYPRM